MIALTYILKTAFIMGIFLIFYKLFLEKEKMHHFNRAYLLSTLVLACIVPLLPTGFSIDQDSAASIATLTHFDVEQAVTESMEMEESILGLGGVVGLVYTLVFLCLGFRFVYNILHFSNVKRQNEVSEMNGVSIVLMNSGVSPFTFMNAVFVNKSAYEEASIDPQLIEHELVHAREKHSWDILFIESLITIFWFNPILRWYKTAIQLNHEFLADDSVLKKYKEVRSYQHLLLDTIESDSMISLASNINFQLTKKRLKMMTKQSSAKRKGILVFSTIPLLFAILLGFGNPAISQSNDPQNSADEIRVNPDDYFKDAIIHFISNDGAVEVVPYSKMSEEQKSKLPPPPPPPPAHPGEPMDGNKIKPLSKSTIVTVYEDGGVFIGNRGAKAIPKPPKPPSQNRCSRSSKMEIIPRDAKPSFFP